MKLLTKIQAAALLCAASCPAFADGVDYQTISDAASKTGDLSHQALVMIFGDVVIRIALETASGSRCRGAVNASG
ncbi:hypothetical protein FHW04_004530 [Pantoea sp. AN62]|uniref:hypothetical protein n=1 Tax=Pantoea TaxID=53335 RepID=UPI000A2615F4|nr:MULTISPECIES: hypothetical protein [Pantoea]MCQ5472807.1 hypothetical protein [Pantoea brenneri]MDU4748679.1 hypothetical protein [Pantoea sp.]ORM54204.1 hypothetical protein HA39_17815 [Pantoea brenneri]OXM18665.1 hypothetical protein CBI35_21755 [Pantoea sp. AV62]